MSKSFVDPTWVGLARWRAISAAVELYKLLNDTEDPFHSTDVESAARRKERHQRAYTNLADSVTTSKDTKMQHFALRFLLMICKWDLYYEGGIYTAKEWQEKGEQYGEGAELVISCEGAVCHALYYGEHEHATAEFQGLLKQHNLDVEWLHCWAFAVRKVHG